MRYKNSDDNRYRVQFMISTEELMDQLTVKEFISYLLLIIRIKVSHKHTLQIEFMFLFFILFY